MIVFSRFYYRNFMLPIFVENIVQCIFDATSGGADINLYQSIFLSGKYPSNSSFFRNSL